jgi:protein TonB
MIDEDGSIGEVEVFQSSGHPGLDKAAIETLRQAAPFHLPRPLGQPRMTIKIPMSYRLDR